MCYLRNWGMDFLKAFEATRSLVLFRTCFHVQKICLHFER